MTWWDPKIQSWRELSDKGEHPLQVHLSEDLLATVLSLIKFPDLVKMWWSVPYKVRQILYEKHFTELEKGMEFYTFRY